MKPYPAYKPSGVPWLGKMPAHWESKAAKFLVTCNDDVLTEDVDPATEIVYVEIADVEEGQGIKATTDMLFKDAPSRARRQVKHGDIIVSTVRTYLKAIAPVENPPDNLVVSTGFAVLRPHGVSQGFAKYAFAESGFINTVIARSNGVSYPAINATDLVRIPIPVPPVEEQQVIASYLDRETARVDTLIAEKGRLIETLREYRQATISEVVTQGLDSAAPKKPSDVPWLGEVPAHWEVRRLKSLLNEPLIYGANEAADGDEPGNPRFVRITDMNDNGCLREETFRSLPLDLAKPYLLIDGDVLLARSGATVGKSFLYDGSWGSCCFAGYLIRARFNQDVFMPKFFYACCQSTFYWQYVSGTQIQSTIQNLNAEKYANLWLPCPPMEEQQAIAAYLDHETTRIDKLLAHVQDEIKLLQELRAATITDAVTGKIQVS